MGCGASSVPPPASDEGEEGQGKDNGEDMKDSSCPIDEQGEGEEREVKTREKKHLVKDEKKKLSGGKTFVEDRAEWKESFYSKCKWAQGFEQRFLGRSTGNPHDNISELLDLYGDMGSFGGELASRIVDSRHTLWRMPFADEIDDGFDDYDDSSSSSSTEANSTVPPPRADKKERKRRKGRRKQSRNRKANEDAKRYGKLPPVRDSKKKMKRRTGDKASTNNNTKTKKENKKASLRKLPAAAASVTNHHHHHPPRRKGKHRRVRWSRGALTERRSLSSGDVIGGDSGKGGRKQFLSDRLSSMNDTYRGEVT
eukprot:jgi/Bigna1/138708/aug1.46_g13416